MSERGFRVRRGAGGTARLGDARRRAGAPGAPRLAALSVAWGLLGLAALPVAPAHAQERPARAWLGVGLQEQVSCSAPPRVEPRCDKTVIVSQVVVDGPADRAGIEPGDTLLAVDGKPLDKGAHDPVFSSLVPGRAVALEVGRPVGRRAIRLVPGTRPRRLAGIRVHRRTPSPEAPAAVAVAPRVWAGGDGAGGRWLEIHLDSGLVRVSPVVEPGTAGVDPPRVVRLEPDVWAQLEFGPRLQALQDSVFLRARVRLDSLRRLRETAMERARQRAAAAPRPGDRAAYAPAAVFERRVAGAEFTPLNPELAEFFDGPDAGLLVLRVLPGTPAARVGLRPGDVVVEAGGRSCRDVEDLRAALGGDDSRAVVVEWSRRGQRMTGVIREE